MAQACSPWGQGVEGDALLLLGLGLARLLLGEDLHRLHLAQVTVVLGGDERVVAARGQDLRGEDRPFGVEEVGEGGHKASLGEEGEGPEGEEGLPSGSPHPKEGPSGVGAPLPGADPLKKPPGLRLPLPGEEGPVPDQEGEGPGKLLEVGVFPVAAVKKARVRAEGELQGGLPPQGGKAALQAGEGLQGQRLCLLQGPALGQSPPLLVGEAGKPLPQKPRQHLLQAFPAVEGLEEGLGGPEAAPGVPGGACRLQGVGQGEAMGRLLRVEGEDRGEGLAL